MDSKIIHYLLGIPVLASTGIASMWGRLFPSSTPLPQTPWGRSQKLIHLTTDAAIICSDPDNPDHWPTSTTITATWEQVNFHADGTSRPASFIWPPVGTILEKTDPEHVAEFVDNVIIANPSGSGKAQLTALATKKDTRITVRASFNDETMDVSVMVKAS